jgi:hypothetical protein
MQSPDSIDLEAYCHVEGSNAGHRPPAATITKPQAACIGSGLWCCWAILAQITINGSAGKSRIMSSRSGLA